MDIALTPTREGKTKRSGSIGDSSRDIDGYSQPKKIRRSSDNRHSLLTVIIIKSIRILFVSYVKSSLFWSWGFVLLYRVLNEIWCPFPIIGTRRIISLEIRYVFVQIYNLLANEMSLKLLLTVYIWAEIYISLKLSVLLDLAWRYRFSFLYDPFSRIPNSMKIFNESKAPQTELEVEHQNKLIVRQKVKGTRLERCSVISSHKDPTIPTSKWTCKASQDLLQRSRKVCIRNISNQTNNIWYVIHYDDFLSKKFNFYILGKI